MRMADDDCPDLLPCAVGSDATARISLEVVRPEPDATSPSLSQAEWAIQVEGLAQSLTSDDLMGLLFEPLQKCRTPVSVYGYSTNFHVWRKLPGIVMLADDEGDEGGDGGHDDAMDEDADEEDVDSDVDESDEWMDDDCDTFSSLLLGVWLVSDAMQNDRQLELMDAKGLKRALMTITAALVPLRPKRITAQTNATEGASRASAVAECLPLCDVHVSIMLKPATAANFDAAVLFDSLLSLGMEYQPRSRQFVFRAPVLDSDGCPQVDDLFMCVPSYSSEEGPLRIDSVKLGFFVPYTPEPLRILEAVKYAAEYVARRQGGALVYDESGVEGADNVFREATKMVRHVSEIMHQMGVPPGSTEAQFLY